MVYGFGEKTAYRLLEISKQDGINPLAAREDVFANEFLLAVTCRGEDGVYPSSASTNQKMVYPVRPIALTYYDSVHPQDPGQVVLNGQGEKQIDVQYIGDIEYALNLTDEYVPECAVVECRRIITGKEVADGKQEFVFQYHDDQLNLCPPSSSSLSSETSSSSESSSSISVSSALCEGLCTYEQTLTGAWTLLMDNCNPPDAVYCGCPPLPQWTDGNRGYADCVELPSSSLSSESSSSSTGLCDGYCYWTMDIGEDGTPYFRLTNSTCTPVVPDVECGCGKEPFNVTPLGYNQYISPCVTVSSSSSSAMSSSLSSVSPNCVCGDYADSFLGFDGDVCAHDRAWTHRCVTMKPGDTRIDLTDCYGKDADDPNRILCYNTLCEWTTERVFGGFYIRNTGTRPYPDAFLYYPCELLDVVYFCECSDSSSSQTSSITSSVISSSSYTPIESSSSVPVTSSSSYAPIESSSSIPVTSSSSIPLTSSSSYTPIDSSSSYAPIESSSSVPVTSSSSAPIESSSSVPVTSSSSVSIESSSSYSKDVGTCCWTWFTQWASWVLDYENCETGYICAQPDYSGYEGEQVCNDCVPIIY